MAPGGGSPAGARHPGTVWRNHRGLDRDRYRMSVNVAKIDAARPRRDGASAERAGTRTDIPARLDRLPWCRFHVLIIVALGVTWILDGLEVTVVGSIGPVLQVSRTLALSAQQIGAA